MRIQRDIASGRNRNTFPIRRWLSGIIGVAVVTFSLVAATLVTGQAVAAGKVPTAPQVSVCGGTPVTHPTRMSWCSSLCSPYMTGIVWKTWSEDGATGVGTLMTNDGEPNCLQGTWTKHPNSVVILGNARMAEYCPESGGHATALLFTETNLWGGVSLPAMKC